MKKEKKRRILSPSLGKLLTLTLLAALTPLLLLAAENVGFFIPYAAYLLVVYILFTLFHSIPWLFFSHRTHLEGGWRALRESAVRERLLLLFSMLGNLLYASFRLVAGGVLRSFWFAAEAIYYITLSIGRYMLAQKAELSARPSPNTRVIVSEWEGYRHVARIICLLCLSFAGLLSALLLEKHALPASGGFAFLISIFTLCRVSVLVILLCRARHRRQPARRAALALSLAGTALALFTVAATWLPLLVGETATHRVTAIFGITLFFGLLTGTAYMLAKSRKTHDI